jgi:thiaminase
MMFLFFLSTTLNFIFKLAKLSKNAHGLAKQYKQKDLEAQEELKEVEGKIDKIVAELYGITDEELEEVRKTLRGLKGE